jgi:hypothetical protein
MMPTPSSNELETTRLSQAQVESLAAVLARYADRCRRVHEDMQRQGLAAIEPYGTKTFIRGAGYVQNFLANLEEALDRAIGADDLQRLIKERVADQAEQGIAAAASAADKRKSRS